MEEPNSYQESALDARPRTIAAQWFALGVASRHEKAVSRLLEIKGYQTFVPVSVRRHQYVRRSRDFEIPLFPGYVFCRTDLSTRLPILTTPGVLRFIGFGREPIPIDDGEMTALQTAASLGVPLTAHAFWSTGERVVITSGPLLGVEGIVLSEKEPLKLILSVTLLRRSVLLEVDTDCVIAAKADHSSPEASC